MNIHSIKFRLFVLGVLAVVLPMAIVGIISIVNSSRSLTQLSKDNALATASHLAILVESTMDVQAKLAQSYAMDTMVRSVGLVVKKQGLDNVVDEIAILREEMKKKFAKLDDNFLGIFVTDSAGELYTGELAGGKEYKGSNVSSREYFQQAKSTGKAVVGDIVRSKSTGALIYVVCAPVLSEGGDFLGVFGISIKATALVDMVSSVKVGSTGYAFMANKEGLIIAHPNEKFILSLDLKTLNGMESITKKMIAGGAGVDSYVFKGVSKIAGFSPVKSKSWTVALTQNEDEFLASARKIRTVILVVTLVTLLVVLTAFFFMAQGISRTVMGFKNIVESEGDLTKRLEIRSKDELGELAEWLNVFMAKLQDIIGSFVRNTGAIDQSAGKLLAVSGSLAESASNMSLQAETVAAATEEMNVNFSNVAAAMEQSSTNVSMVASAAEEMSSTIDEIAQNANTANQITNEAVQQSERTGTRMKALGEAVRTIGRVTETIAEISDQTNLLALNATIEAARAGEAGKGFAVVANEIKELAKQTAKATLDIKEQISGVQESTSKSVADIDTISNIINQVNEIVATIASAVSQQSAATQEISSNISQASLGLQEVNENVSQSSAVALSITQEITGVNTASSEIADNSEEVKGNAEELQKLAIELKTIVSQFKV